MSPDPLTEFHASCDRSLRSRRRKRRRRRSPEKRRVHVCPTDGGAVVALYDDDTWDYMSRPDEVSYEEDL